MEANRLIGTMLKRLLAPLLARGIAFGIDRAAGGKKRPSETASGDRSGARAAQAQARSARAQVRQARQAMRAARRIGRF